MTVFLNSLPEATLDLFHHFSKLKFFSQFCLVGGSALALQIGHRQSVDLDFIQDGEKLNDISIKRFILKNFPDYQLIREERGYQLDFQIRNVKVTFFSTGTVLIPFHVKDRSFKHGFINIADVLTLSVLKLSAIAQRNTLRDYYDLYIICRFHIPLKDVYTISREINPGLPLITYSETIIYTKDIPEDSTAALIDPKVDVTKEEIASFFISELKRLKAEE
jgi:hypothetical protein